MGTVDSWQTFSLFTRSAGNVTQQIKPNPHTVGFGYCSNMKWSISLWSLCRCQQHRSWYRSQPGFWIWWFNKHDIWCTAWSLSQEGNNFLLVATQLWIIDPDHFWNPNIFRKLMDEWTRHLMFVFVCMYVYVLCFSMQRSAKIENALYPNVLS